MSIFLDFDGTITAQDTISELANFALRFQNSRQQLQPEAGVGADLKPQWDAVVKAYIDDHKAQVACYRPAEAARRELHEKVAFLRDLKAVETRSLARIKSCALFQGITPAAFREAGRALVREGTVVIRPGFADFVRRRVEQGWRVYVVSVNWSSAFIEGACGGVDGLSVIANDVREEDGSVAGPEVLNAEGREQHRNLTNSCDKLDVMTAVLERDGLVRDGSRSFYLGDSTTDLECLLAATRGIVVADRDDTTLLRTLRRIGKSVPRVRDADQGAGLSWASDFEEVMAHVEFELG
ncbi:Uu.00g019420.m01.CDS01 [Anthostomella pinea]|uniref:Uu.00g019420.m01.CDS01 n=1 Tax=Anthostomella pinea TaxID=933095 RepID=A0AAI8VZA9_9PEZI|nr:Uu.00g019420.m01.CDS01 [Anthostomella pinea]